MTGCVSGSGESDKEWGVWQGVGVAGSGCVKEWGE